MGFRVGQRTEFWWDCIAQIPEGNRWQKHRFSVLFRLFDKAAAQGIVDNPTDENIKSIVLDWKGVEDDAGNPIKCDGDTVEAVLQSPEGTFFRLAVLRGYNSAILGEDLRKGN